MNTGIVTTSIYRKIVLGFAVVLLLSIVMATVGFVELRNIRGVVEDFIPSVTERRLLERVMVGIETLESDMDSFSVVSGEEHKERLERDIHEILRLSGELEKIVTDRSTRIAVGALAERSLRLEDTVHELIGIAEHTTNQNELILTAYQRIASLRQSYEILSAQSDRVFGERIAMEQKIITNAIAFSIMIETLIIGIGTFLALYLSQLLTNPIRHLRETASKIAGGDAEARAAIESSDEIGELAATFNTMADRLANYTKDLEEKVADRTKALAEKMEALDRVNKELDQSAQLLIKRDLELTRTNDRLRELDQVKSEFLSIAAHQLRTPLSAVKWVFSLLLEEHNGSLSDEQRNFLQKGLDSNERMIHLVDDMLTVTRIESGKLEYVMEDLDLAKLARDVAEDVTKSAERKHVTLACFDDGPAIVTADGEKLRFVLDNLLSNAIKYTPENGTVEAKIAIESGVAILTIRDTGIGIPKEQQQNVFSKFFRAENAVRTVSDGTGLGLYVAKRIIEHHHGTISFTSDVGAGTTFRVALPLAPERAEKVS